MIKSLAELQGTDGSNKSCHCGAAVCVCMCGNLSMFGMDRFGSMLFAAWYYNLF